MEMLDTESADDDRKSISPYKLTAIRTAGARAHSRRWQLNHARFPGRIAQGRQADRGQLELPAFAP